MDVKQLKKQAKELVRSRARGRRRGRRAVRRPAAASSPSAQLVLAREHGYPSWPALVRVEVEQPFHDDIEYYEGRAEGIATVKASAPPTPAATSPGVTALAVGTR